MCADPTRARPGGYGTFATMNHHCSSPATTEVHVDIDSRDGYSLAVCDAHLDDAIVFHAELGHAVCTDPARRGMAHCAYEARWADPDATVRDQVDGFLDATDQADLTAGALAGDRDALVELLVRHAGSFVFRPLR